MILSGYYKACLILRVFPESLPCTVPCIFEVLKGGIKYILLMFHIRPIVSHTNMYILGVCSRMFCGQGYVITSPEITVLQY